MLRVMWLLQLLEEGVCVCCPCYLPRDSNSSPESERGCGSEFTPEFKATKISVHRQSVWGRQELFLSQPGPAAALGLTQQRCCGAPGEAALQPPKPRAAAP